MSARFLFVLLSLCAACKRSGELLVVAESAKVKRGDSGKSALTNDGVLALRGVRGDVLTFQVLDGKGAVSVSLPGIEVELFQIDYLDVREPSTKMYGESRGKGAYPDILRPVPAAERGAVPPVLVELRIPRGTPAGTQKGELTVGEKRFAITLRVEDVEIDLADDPLVWVFYHPKEIARVHGLAADDDSPEEVAYERKYHALFRQHGCYLATNLRPNRFPARKEFATGVRYWPVSVSLTDDNEAISDVRAWQKIFPPTQPIKMFAIPIDEPHTPAERARVKHYGELIAAAGGGILRSVTAPPHPDYDGFVDLYITPETNRKPRFTYNGQPPVAGAMILDTDGIAMTTWGWIAYLYNVDLWYAWEGLYFSDRYNKGGPTDVFHNPNTFDERRKGPQDWGNGNGVLAYPGALPSLRLKALRRGLIDRKLLYKLDACGEKGRGEARRIAHKLIPRALHEALTQTGPAPWPTDEKSWNSAREELLDALLTQCK